MLASDADIDLALKQDLLTVTPTEPELLQPASIDLRLDHRFRTYRTLDDLRAKALYDDPLGAPLPDPVIDPALNQDDLMIEWDIPDGHPFLLPAGGFALGGTLERVTVSGKIAVKLEGKSSLARRGLIIHTTAGWIDPGFDGWITLELFNTAPYPIRLWPGMKIGQMAVMALNTPARRPYGTGGLNSHYQHQPAGPQPSQSWRNFRTWPTRTEPAHA